MRILEEIRIQRALLVVVIVGLVLMGMTELSEVINGGFADIATT